MARSTTAGRSARAAAFAAWLKRVDWPLVWHRARFIAHHSKRFYANLTESERKELLDLVAPSRDRKLVPKQDRARVVELLTKAVTGSPPRA